MSVLNLPLLSRFGGLSLVNSALIVGAGTSASLLIGAHLFEAFGYAPCGLCLDQREAHWTALAITLVGLFISIGFKGHRAAAAATGTAALVYAFSTILAFYHTGIEFSFWPGPASCSGSGTITNITDLSASLESDKVRVSCSEAAWRLFGISMAGYNFIVSAGLFALSLLATIGGFRKSRREKRA